MANERCPSCAAVVRAGDPWCTLCWTDLRPAPAVPPPAPAAEAPLVAVPAVAVAAPVTYAPLVDPLSAPLAVVLGQAPVATPPVAPEATTATWPCVQCGAANPIDLDTCAACTTPFGGRIRRLDDAKGQRRKVLLVGLGVVGAFLLLLGAVTFAATDTSGVQKTHTNQNGPAGVDFNPVN